MGARDPAGTGRKWRACTILVLAALVGACATTPEYSALSDKDRFERFNRFSFRVHQGLDRFAIRPVARAYYAVPDKLTNRVSNFFANLRGPVDISNNLLQGKFKYGFSGIGRLLVNSTIGLGGLFDPATRIGLPRHQEDLGQTLAGWNVPSGPYIFLPIIGPSTPRHLAGRIGDWQIDPLARYDNSGRRNSLVILDRIDRRAELLSPGAEGLLERSNDDEYDAVRRQYQNLRDGQIGVEPPDLFDFD
jgi:phospholipid-binding lipoprotein MlaA